MIKVILGFIVGLLEMLGLKYPVKEYYACVSSSLWRGSRIQSEATISDLEIIGIKSIINLCAERDLDGNLWKKFKLFRIRILDNTVPSIKQINEFLSIVANSANQPVYVHCEAGKGRTGVMVACYRIKVEGWTNQEAIEEAKKYGMVLKNQINFLKTYNT